MEGNEFKPFFTQLRFLSRLRCSKISAFTDSKVVRGWDLND